MSKQFLHQVGMVLKVFFARLRFLAVFIVAALAVGYWDNIKNHVDKWTRPAVAPEVAGTADSDVEYFCVMHPYIIRSVPGDCPICGMPLAKRKKGEKIQLPENVLARVQLSPQRIALAGIETSPVAFRKLSREIHTVGVLDYNEARVAQLSARVAGRADELFLRYTGQDVRQGDPVYSLYSPEVYSAQREYLLARKRVNDLPKNAPAELRADATEIYYASLQKLLLWGITRQQLEEMDKKYDQAGTVPTHLTVTSPISGIVIRKDVFEGAYLQTGDRPYTIADLRTLWLKAKIYEQDVPLVRLGQTVNVTVEAFPNELFTGAVTFRAFQLDPQTRTLDARIEIANPGLRLRPGMFADAFFTVPVTPAAGPATAPAATQSTDLANATVYTAALKPYLQAMSNLAQDKSDNVSVLLHETLARLEPISHDPRIEPAYNRLTESVHKTMNKNIEGIRTAAVDISTALIDIGRIARLTPDAPPIQVYYCGMKKARWLQVHGPTANPYYGSAMLECGEPVESLPRVDARPAAPSPATRPAEQVLAIPRSAVIDTGRRKIVFIQTASGVYDMRAVQLAPLAGDDYPVLSGLQEGDRVVTRGAFLLDAENRLNPSGM